MPKKHVNTNSNIFNDKNKLGSGIEGKVYKVNNDIYKLFHSTKNTTLTEELCIYLSSIKTKQIRMPETILYNENGEFCGYTTFYLNKGNGLHFGNMTVQEFFTNLNVLYQDVNLLSQKHIKLEDINLFVTSDYKIYAVDVGKYQFLSEVDTKDIEKNNEVLLNDSIVDLFQNCFVNTPIVAKVRDYFKEIPLKKESFVKELHILLDYYSDVNSFLSDLYDELVSDKKIGK